jgi:hypothetical protein
VPATAPTTQTPVEPPLPSAAVPAARARTLDDVVLDTPTAADAAKSDGLDTVAFRRPKGGGGGLLTIAAALALVAVGAWFVLRPRGEGGGSPYGPTNAAAASTSTPSVPDPSPPSAPERSVPAAAIAADPGAPAAANPPAEAEAPPVEVAPPAPEPAILVIAPGWDSAMTVRFGKRSWTLDRERRFELEPGSYKLRFAIASPAYSREEETTVRLDAGATKRVTSPLERPGRLTVQPHLNTPQGFVRLDGAVAGTTPLRGRWLAPGPHVVEIASTPDPGAAAVVRESVQIESDRETLLTFDLAGKLERRVSSRAALPN